MKILYAIQGTGNRHTSRALEIIPHLQNRADVDILISGNQSQLKLPFDINYKYHGLSFALDKKGSINIWQTFRKAKLRTLWKDIKSVPVEEYDLVISDLEPISTWACQLKNVPIISLSHQNAVLDEKAPKYGILRLERLILKYYAPAKNKFGFHFKTYSSSTFFPIIRKEIRYTRPTKKGHYTVYLPCYSNKKIISILSNFKNTKWQVFSKNSDNYIFKENITIQPINKNDFTKSITSATGVLCGAGFETPSEALFLKKKLMVIPIKNHYEQQCNALALQELGVSVLKKLETKELSRINDWIKNGKIIDVNYPDVTQDILDAIILPYYNQSIYSNINIG